MSRPSRKSLSDALGGLKDDLASNSVEHAESNTEGTLELPGDLPAVSCGFDFGNVPAETLAEISLLQRAIVVKLTATIIAMGEDLLRLRELIEQHCVRGTWTRYLETGLPFSENSARNYMKAAKASRRFRNGATVAGKIFPTALYEVRDVPAEIVEEIERRVDEGETLIGRDVRDMRHHDLRSFRSAVLQSIDLAQLMVAPTSPRSR